MKIHIQGDRTIAQDPERVKVIQLIAEEMKRRGDVAILGAYGDVAKIFADILGEQAICYGHQPGKSRGQCPESVKFVDCGELTAKIDYPDNRVVGWGIRQGLMMYEADGFIFFPGGEGTLADLMAAIAHCIKCEGAHKSKYMILIDWPIKKLHAIEDLYGWDNSNRPIWLRYYVSLKGNTHRGSEYVVSLLHGE